MKIGIHELEGIKWETVCSTPEVTEVVGELGEYAYRAMTFANTPIPVVSCAKRAGAEWAVDVSNGRWQPAQLTVRYYPVLLPVTFDGVTAPARLEKPTLRPTRVAFYSAITPDVVNRVNTPPSTYVVCIDRYFEWPEGMSHRDQDRWRGFLDANGLGWNQSVETLFGYDKLPHSVLPPGDVGEMADIESTVLDPSGTMGALDYFSANPAFTGKA